jgi:hypothetical protein
MNNRISTRDLDNLVDNLNTHNETTDYKTIGHYQIGAAYSGFRLEQIVNSSGGVRVISPFGYGTKRELYIFLKGFTLRDTETK